MEGSSVKQTVNEYKHVYGQLRSKYFWHVGDQRVLMMAASSYIVNSKPFDLERYIELTSYIKKQSPLFSPLRSHQRFITAAMLEQRFDSPEEKFHELTDIYDKLVKSGFRRGPFTYIAALVLLNNDDDGSSHEASIARSLEIYNSMKKNHPFITSKNDYPLSVLLARLEEKTEQLMERIESYYRKLSDNGFRKGNDLQFLSHILSLEKGEDERNYLTDCLHIWDELKKRKIKMKRMHYPAAGLLTLIEPSAAELDKAAQWYEQLNRTKWFKWQRDMNTIMAVNFTVKEKMEEHSVFQAGIHTTMETVIQAQQAAMIAAVTAGSAAGASSSGGNN